MGGFGTFEPLVLFVSLLDECSIYALQSTGVLAHVARRRVLAALLDRERTCRPELAAMLANDDAVDGDDPDRIAIALHHRHLPKLDAAGIVDYDSRSGDVVRWTDPETAAELLERE